MKMFGLNRLLMPSIANSTNKSIKYKNKTGENFSPVFVYHNYLILYQGLSSRMKRVPFV